MAIQAPVGLRYEYDVYSPRHSVGLDEVLSELNKRGAAGWKIFKVHESMIEARMYFWMRRKVVGLEPIG